MKSIADIKAIREEMQSQVILRENPSDNETKIVVGMATCGISAGARPVFDALVDEVAARKIKNVKVIRSGCIEMCKLEPIVEIVAPDKEKVTYVRVTPEKAKKIIAEHIVNGNVCTEYLITNE